MAQIPITNLLGLDLDASLSHGEKFSELVPGFLDIKDRQLDQVPVHNLNLVIHTHQPIGKAMDGWQLGAGEVIGGRIAVIDARKRTLDEDGPFDAIEVKAGEIYLELALTFSLEAGVKDTAGPAIFGFAANKGFEIRCYRRFTPGASGFLPFGAALAETLSSFVLPGTAEEISQLDSDTILSFAGQGELSVSAGFTIQTPANALASTSIGFGPKIQLNEGGALTTEAKLTMKGGYRVQLRRTSPGNFEIGIYNLKSRELALSVTAEIGISAGVGQFDLLEQLIGALSRQPAIDVKEFRNALPFDDAGAARTQIATFQREIKDTISSKLQASLSASFSRLGQNEGIWIFEVDKAPAMSADLQRALSTALHGDLTLVTRDPKGLPSGLRQQKNVLVNTNASQQKLRVNVLGLLNYLSLTKIAQISNVERNSDGDVTLVVDTSDASRLEAVLLNAGWDAKRLRKMLSEDFLISATYQVSNLHVFPPQFTSRQTHLDIINDTGQKRLRDELTVARVLGLITPEEQIQRSSGNSFGRTTFFVSTKYSGSDIERLLFDSSGNRRAVEEFETAGRSALAALLSGEQDQALRLRFAQLGSGDALWGEMKRVGNTAEFGPLFGFAKGALNGEVQAAGADFITITEWANSMSKVATAVSNVRNTLKSGSVSVDDPNFIKARQELKERMEAAVKDTHDEFGDPLGLLMVYVASGEKGERRVLVTGEHIEILDRSSAVQVRGSAA